MAHTHLYLSHDNTLVQGGRRKRQLLRAAVNKAMGVLSGVERGSAFALVGSGTDPAYACTAGISASGSGTVGIVVAGVTLTATWGTSDTVSAALIAAVINASTNAKIQYLIGSTNLRNKMTLASVLVGTTVTIAGFKFTAISGTTESNKDGEFVIGGTDTADANSLCLAIQRHPYASKWLFAVNVAGIVYTFPKTTSAAWFTGPGVPPNQVTASAATITLSEATFIASPYYGLWVRVPGKIGNNIVIAASGTGQTIENSNTYFSRGLGGDAVPVHDSI